MQYTELKALLFFQRCLMNLAEKGHTNGRKNLHLHVHENLCRVLVKMKYRLRSLEII